MKSGRSRLLSLLLCLSLLFPSFSFAVNVDNGGVNLTANGVPYAVDADTIATDTGLVFDPTNNRLTVGVSPGSGSVLNLAGAATTYGQRRLVDCFDTTTMAAGVGCGIALFGRTDGAGSYAEFGNVAGVKENSTSGDLRGNLIFATGTNPNAITIERMRILSDGKVGIGTSAPVANLDVRGSNSFARVGNDSGARYIGASQTGYEASDGTRKSVFGTDPSLGFAGMYSNHDFALITNNGAKLYIEAGGDVGIGTTSPSTKLDVAGGIRSTSGVIESTSGGFKFPDTSTLTSSATLVTGTGASGRCAFWTGAQTLDDDAGCLYDSATDKLTLAGLFDAQGGVKYPDGNTQSAAGITGSLTTTRVPFATGARTLGDNSKFVWDNTNASLQVTGTDVTDYPSYLATVTQSGSRVNEGIIAIPPKSYGSGGPRASTYVNGLLVNSTDSTTYGSNGTDNSGAPSSAVVINQSLGANYTGIGHGLIVQSNDARNIGAVTLPTEQDIFNVMSIVVADQTVNPGATFDGAGNIGVVSVNYYALSSRISADSFTEGVRIVMSNFVDDRKVKGLNISAGDAVNNGPEYPGGQAIYINARNERGTVDSFEHAFLLERQIPGGGTRKLFDMKIDGSVAMDLWTGFSGNMLEMKVAGTTKFVVSDAGDVGATSLTLASLTGGGNAAACLNSSGVLYRSTTTSCP